MLKSWKRKEEKLVPLCSNLRKGGRKRSFLFAQICEKGGRSSVCWFNISSNLLE